MYWALGLSVLIHLLLLLLSDRFPLSLHAATPFEESPQEITFTFADDVEPTTDDPLEDAPFLPIEERSVAEPPPDLVPAEIPSPAVDPAPVLEPVEEPPVEEPLDPTSADLPLADQGQVSERTSEEIDTAAEPRPLDVRQALRDFRRTVTVRPPAPAQVGGSPTPRNIVMPDISDLPTTGFGVGNLVFESRDYDWDDYGRQIYWAIWKAWHNRLWMTTDEFEKWAYGNESWYLEHQTQVRFVIESNGQVTGIVQESGSGCGPLDDSALDALSEVVLPPLPVDFPRDREVVHAGFHAKGPIRGLKPTLRRYKARGLF